MQIYVDMDDVLCDFSKRFSTIIGINREDVGDYFRYHTDMWDILKKEGESFWSELDWNPGGKELWSFVKDLNPVLLTAPSPIDDGGSSCSGKRLWVNRNLGDVPIIFEIEKYKHSGKGRILIDDLPKNIDPWIYAGGVGILHLDTRDTISELKNLL